MQQALGRRPKVEGAAGDPPAALGDDRDEQRRHGQLPQPVEAGRGPGDRAADARAWHLAAAALAPDDEVAYALRDMGGRARVRGAYVEAARAFERAAELTRASEPRVRRLTQAAKCWQLAGRVGRAGRLLADAPAAGTHPPGGMSLAQWLFCSRLGSWRAVSPFTFRSDCGSRCAGSGSDAHFGRVALARILQSLSQSAAEG